jgi:hypothetical protein
MILLRNRNFSGTNILNTSGVTGFIRGRKYDTDLDRLGRMNTSHREMTRVGDLSREMREMSSELNRGLRQKDLRD